MGKDTKLIVGAVLTVGSFFIPWARVAQLAFAVGASLFSAGLQKDREKLSQKSDGIKATVRSTQATLPVVYGITKIGASIVDIVVDPDSTDDKDLYVTAAICVASEDGNGINDINNVWFGDKLAITSPIVFGAGPNTSGVQTWLNGSGTHCQYGAHKGTDTQTADPMLTGLSVGGYTNFAGKGIAYMTFMLRYDDEIFRTGIPDITFEVEGNRVYDPRTSTWDAAVMYNPALCLLDYLTSKRYGPAFFYPERDGGDTTESFIDEQSFIDAANYCEEQVNKPPSGTEDRFLCNGWFYTDDEHANVVGDLLSSMRGSLIFQNGKLRLQIRSTATPTSYVLDESKIKGEFVIKRAGADEVPNAIIASFTAADTFQVTDVAWPLVSDPNAFLTADNGVLNQIKVDLPFTNGYYQALRTIMVTLRELREDVYLSVRAHESARILQVGDVVPVTHSGPGWTQKDFYVAEVSILPEGDVQLALQEHADSAYNLDTLTSEATLPGTNLPNPFFVEPPTGLSVLSDSTTALATQDGQKIPRGLASWTAAPDPFLDHYRLKYKQQADSDWEPFPLIRSDETRAFIVPVEDGVLYDVELVAVNTLGIESTAATTSFTGGTDQGDAIGVAIVDEDDPDLKLHVIYRTALSGRYLVKTSPIVDANEVHTTGTLFVSPSNDIVIHTFTTDGEHVYVGVVFYTDASGTQNMSALQTLEWTYHIGDDFPDVHFERAIVSGQTNPGDYNGVDIVVDDDGDQVATEYEITTDGVGGGVIRVPGTGYVSDPQRTHLEVPIPTEGDPATYIRARGLDDGSNVSPWRTYYIDFGSKPNGTIKLIRDDVTGEHRVIVESADGDTGSYRIRMNVAAIGSNSFLDPVPNDGSSDEFTGSQTAGGLNGGGAINTMWDVPAAFEPGDGEELFISGFLYQTTATSQSAHSATQPKSPLKISSVTSVGAFGVWASLEIDAIGGDGWIILNGPGIYNSARCAFNIVDTDTGGAFPTIAFSDSTSEFGTTNLGGRIALDPSLVLSDPGKTLQCSYQFYRVNSAVAATQQADPLPSEIGHCSANIGVPTAPAQVASVDLVYDKGVLVLHGVAGYGCKSVVLEIADNDAFTSPVQSQTVNVTQGNDFATTGYTVAEADRGQTWYGRATAWTEQDGAGGTGIAGETKQDREYVTAIESDDALLTDTRTRGSFSPVQFLAELEDYHEQGLISGSVLDRLVTVPVWDRELAVNILDTVSKSLGNAFLESSVDDNLGRSVNRFLMKSSAAGSPDDFDEVLDGGTFRKLVSVDVSGQAQTGSIKDDAVTGDKVPTGAIGGDAHTKTHIVAGTVTIVDLEAVVISGIIADLGTITAGIIQNAAASPTAAIRVSSGYAMPGTATEKLDLVATGTGDRIRLTNGSGTDLLRISADGSTAKFGGNILTASTVVTDNSIQINAGRGSGRISLSGDATSGTFQLNNENQNSNLFIRMSAASGGDVQITTNGASAGIIKFLKAVTITSGNLTLDTGNIIVSNGTIRAGTPPTYTPTNVTTDRSYDANSTTLDEIADVVGTMIGDLQTIGLFQ